MRKRAYTIGFLFQIFICACSVQPNEKKPPFKALIIDGTSSHYVWPKTSLMMKDYLEQTALFEVSIHRMDTVWLGIKYSSTRTEPLDYYIKEFPLDSTYRFITSDTVKTTDFEINFDEYDLIVSNLGTSSPSWSAKTKKLFENYMKAGGGFVVVHSANTVWGDWEAYNEMIGLGTWGGRDSTNGPFVYYDQQGKLQMDYSAGICGSHGAEHEYLVTSREPNHPILDGLPKSWLHAQDELYDRLRGPFKDVNILATAYSDVEINKQPWDPILPGTGVHIPVLMTINYGEGRVFHTTLGHFDYSMECIGFITTFQRGAEWAASGKVTQKIPDDFPTPNESKSKKWEKSL